MIKDLKLLIADIDGTLVNNARQMLPITKAVLEDLHERGVLLGLASGRPIGPHLLTSVHEEWGLSFDFDCYIGMNGGQLLDMEDDSFQEIYTLKPDTIREIFQAIQECGIPGNPFLYEGEDILVLEMDELMQASVKRHKNNFAVAKDLSGFWQHDTPKVLWRLKDVEDMPKMERFFAERSLQGYAAFKTQENLMEFQDPRVSKGAALITYLEKKGISPEKTMVFGDMTNDILMLKAAGWGVCLCSGSEDAKAAADSITEFGNEEDGFGRYLLKHWYAPNGWNAP